MPERWSPERGPEGGPERQVECPDCKGTGKKGDSTCPRCDGDGKIVVRR